MKIVRSSSVWLRWVIGASLSMFFTMPIVNAKSLVAASPLAVPLTVPVFSVMPMSQYEPALSRSAAKTLTKVGKLIEKKAYESALAELTHALSTEQDAALYYTKASIALRVNHIQEAQQSLQHALTIHPGFTRAQAMLAWVYTRNERYTEARVLLQDVIAVKGDSSTYMMLGFGFLQQQNYLAAQSAYQQALILTSAPAPVLRGLLQAYLAMDATEMALSVLDNLLAIESTSADLYIVRAQLAQAQDNIAEAINSLSIAQTFSQRQDIRWQLSQLYLQQGLYQSAVEQLSPLLTAKTLPDSHQLGQMVAYMIANGGESQAHKVITALQNRRDMPLPLTAQLYALEGQLAQQKGDMPKAINAYQKSVKLDPTQGRYQLQLALLTQQTSPIVAEQLFAKAAMDSNVAVEALTYHAQLLLQSQSYQRALVLLEKAHKLAPNRQGINDNIETVRRLINL
ncbi:tetratricopeptide repeat protein [Photobacterium nomapromontoriensis]|uniref:tetratricopeptide repeat protein n=1 Tax=Photobacterium nomapromontoriensis TaxID=2910237 RepID=UPI003D1307B2